MAAEASREPGRIGRAWKGLKEAWDGFHVGDGHAAAMGRQGFKELAHGLLPAFPHGQYIVEEPGLLGNPTQSEVANERKDEPATTGMQQEQDAGRLKGGGYAQRQSPGRDEKDKGIEPEM